MSDALKRKGSLSPRDALSDEQLTPAQIEALVRFAEGAVDEWASSGGDSDVFDPLEATGLIVQIEGGFDPDKHDGPYTDFLEPGDDYYVIAPWLASAYRRLKEATGGDTRGEANTPLPSNAYSDMKEALEAGLALKGGWREAIVELEDFCSEPVRLKNMLAAADQLDAWAAKARAALKTEA